LARFSFARVASSWIGDIRNYSYLYAPGVSVTVNDLGALYDAK